MGYIAPRLEARVEPTTPYSPFTLDMPTQATVQSNTPLGSGNIYNIFGASNGGNDAPDDIYFEDVEETYTIDFTTPTPVRLVGIALYTQGDGANNGEGPDDNRGVSSFSFAVNGTKVVSGVNPVDTNEVNGYANIYTFAGIEGSDFEATFTPNPGAEFPGSRILELDGLLTPEPNSSVLLLIGVAGICLWRPRRRMAVQHGST